MSADDFDAQCAFAAKASLAFPLVADVDRTVIDAYGVWGEKKSSDGTASMGIRRMTFLIGKDGRIRKVYPNVSPDGHASEVLADLDR